jgi:hypothetical protein
MMIQVSFKTNAPCIKIFNKKFIFFPKYVRIFSPKTLITTFFYLQITITFYFIYPKKRKILKK